MLSRQLHKSALRSLRTTGARGITTHVSPVGGTANPGPIQSVMDSIFSKSTMPRVSLAHEMPGLPALATPTAVECDVQYTTLPSGLRVASTESNSPTSSVGVFIDAGSRFETRDSSGISHFLEFTAFNSTSKRSDFRLVRDMQKLGAKVACSTSSEHTLYAADSLREHMPEMIETLADVITNQSFAPMEISAACKKYSADADARAQQADVQVMQGIHTAAYLDETVGLPLYAPKHNLGQFTPEVLRAHVDTFYTPSRMVIAGVGVDHAEFVQHVAAAFCALPADVAGGIVPASAKYVGGEVRQHIPGSQDPFAHIALAFETAHWHHADLVPMCVLQVMMGQGGAFTAGGPGKGMYSRLNENVLNRFGWVESASSFNVIFNDSALFGIYATAEAQNAEALTETLVQQFREMRGPVSAEELSRAQKQLKGTVNMKLEAQANQLEDIGRQLLTTKDKKIQTPAEICALIDGVTAADVQRVATNMLKTPPSLSAYGDLTRLPRYDAIVAALK